MSIAAPRISAYAPGRVELLGNHTDYNEGVVLAGAIDRGITVQGARREDGIIALRSITVGRSVQVPAKNFEPQFDEPWANYPLGVARELARAGVRVPSFELEISGNVPLGGGLSSSAALEVATAFFLLKLTGASMEPLEIAKLCQRAENDFVGVQSGLLDQATSVFGQADHAVFLDCRTNVARVLPFPSGYALVIADSGVKHSLVQGEYNMRREQCAAAARSLGVAALRDVDSALLSASTLNPLIKRRAAHVVGENERVLKAIERLAVNDGEGFGALMNASHESSRVNFENSAPALDLLVQIARSLPGVLGARLTGGGFGGSTVNLTREGTAAEVAKLLSAEYSRRSGNSPQVFVCRLAEGAH